MTAPCLNCPNRHLRCHGECERYKAYDVERNLIRANRGAQQSIEQNIFKWRDEKRSWGR